MQDMKNRVRVTYSRTCRFPASSRHADDSFDSWRDLDCRYSVRYTPLMLKLNRRISTTSASNPFAVLRMTTSGLTTILRSAGNVSPWPGTSPDSNAWVG